MQSNCGLIPGLKSAISTSKLISTSKKKKVHADNDVLNLPPESSHVHPLRTMAVNFVSNIYKKNIYKVLRQFMVHRKDKHSLPMTQPEQK